MTFMYKNEQHNYGVPFAAALNTVSHFIFFFLEVSFRGGFRFGSDWIGSILLNKIIRLRVGSGIGFSSIGLF
jgi:hypothetical protein